MRWIAVGPADRFRVLVVARDVAADLPPERDYDRAFSQVTASYTTKTVVLLPVAVVPRTPPGRRVLTVEVAFQACDGRLCLPARVVRLEAPVTISK